MEDEMTNTNERHETIIIGGGQAGLAVGYHLAKARRPFLILEANARVGDSWRKRWDSLRLFTPAELNGLPGLRFPAANWTFPTNDEMPGYLETYAQTFRLPLRLGARVTRLSRTGERFVIETNEVTYQAANVVVASAPDP